MVVPSAVPCLSGYRGRGTEKALTTHSRAGYLLGSEAAFLLGYIHRLSLQFRQVQIRRLDFERKRVPCFQDGHYLGDKPGHLLLNRPLNAKVHSKDSSNKNHTAQ